MLQWINIYYYHFFLSYFYLYSITISCLDEPTTMTCNVTTQQKDSDLEEEDVIPEEIVRELENFENKPKSVYRENGHNN